MFSLWTNVLTHLPFEVPPQLPLVLPPTVYHPFRLPMCAEPAGSGLEVVVQVVVKTGGRPGPLPVSFNAGWPRLAAEAAEPLLFPCGSLTRHVAGHAGREVRFPLELVREGWNEIVVENGGPDPLELVGLEVGIRPMAAAGA